MLIKGSNLTAAQRTEVLAAYVHRWTFEREAALGECPGCRQRRESGASMTIKIDGHPDRSWHEHHVPLVSDETWLEEHSFFFTKSGHLSRRHRWAEPASLADVFNQKEA